MSDLLKSPGPIDVIDSAPCAVGECPLWDHRDGSILWIDVRGPSIHRRAADGRKSTWTLDGAVGSIALARLPNGAPGLMVAGFGGSGLRDFGTSGLRDFGPPALQPRPHLLTNSTVSHWHPRDTDVKKLWRAG